MLDPKAVSYLGYAYHRYGDYRFGIRQADRMHHCYLIGQTGTGKSTLLANLALQDAKAGRSFLLLDPHGDLALSLSQSLGGGHIYWDVANPSSAYGYNPLARVPEHLKPLVASGFIATLKQQWADSWGARMEHMLRFAILALLDQPATNLSEIIPLYVDKEFRRQVVARIRNEQVRKFWTEEFPKLNYVTTVDGLPPIANKLGGFLANPVVRNAVCQPATPLRFRRAMDKGEVVIVNLAKGRVGSDIANVIGGLLVASVMNAALSRQDLAFGDRRPFFIYVDEFHSFTTGVFADMLSEARKYGLAGVFCQQHTQQTDPAVMASLWGNVGTLLALRIGATDGPIVARQMGELEPSQLTRMPNYHGFAQLMVDGRKTVPFSFRTLPMSAERTAR